MARTLSPSGSAVYWLFRAHVDKLAELRRVDLIQLSMMSDTSFDNGVKNAVAAGLITHDTSRAKYGVNISNEKK